MKKTVYLLLFVLFLSCTKESNKISNVEDLSETAKEVLKAPSMAAMKRASTLLSDEDRQQLWVNKFNTILKNDAGKLSVEQAKIIEMWKSYLVSKGIAGMRGDLKGLDIMFKQNLTYMQKHFTASQIFFLLECPYFTDDFSILNAEQRYLASNKDETNILARETCTCRFYCSGRAKSCTDNGCNAPQNGCGPFDYFACTGVCTNDKVDDFGDDNGGGTLEP